MTPGKLYRPIGNNSFVFFDCAIPKRLFVLRNKDVFLVLKIQNMEGLIKLKILIQGRILIKHLNHEFSSKKKLKICFEEVC